MATAKANPRLVSCGNERATITLPDRTVNYESDKITYGPRPPQA
jgi:hypothetical protein